MEVITETPGSICFGSNTMGLDNQFLISSIIPRTNVLPFLETDCLPGFRDSVGLRTYFDIWVSDNLKLNNLSNTWGVILYHYCTVHFSGLLFFGLGQVFPTVTFGGLDDGGTVPRQVKPLSFVVLTGPSFQTTNHSLNELAWMGWLRISTFRHVVVVDLLLG